VRSGFRRPGTSRGFSELVAMDVGGRGHVLESLRDVFAFQVGVPVKNLLERPPRGNEPDDGSTEMLSPRMHGLPSSVSGTALIRSNAMKRW
jgi:hypothetical protein